jgi:hypothetical protein
MLWCIMVDDAKTSSEYLILLFHCCVSELFSGEVDRSTFPDEKTYFASRKQSKSIDKPERNRKEQR